MFVEWTPASPQPKHTALIALLAGVITVELFSRAIGFAFVNYDDDVYVYENPHVLAGLSGSGLRYALTTGDVGTWAPFTWLSYQSDTTLFGPRASSYHLTNILFHAAAGALLFVALQALGQSLWVAVTVAALFLLHPLRSESVVWIAERKDVLCAFFWMLGLVAYSAYARRPNGRRWWAVFLCFVAGVMSKMMMVTFPFVLLLLDYWPLRRVALDSASWRQQLRRILLEKVPFFATAILTLCITGTALHSRGAFSARPSGGVSDLLRVPENYMFYIGKLFWPAHLSVLYPLREVRPSLALLSAAVLAGATLAAIWKARALPGLAVGWLWFLGTPVPVVGFVPFGDFDVADRYAYLPSVGLCWGLVTLAEHAAYRFAAARWSATALLAIACAVATLAGLPRWRDSFSLYDAALRVGPHYVTYNNRGVALGKARETPAALADFATAIRLNPRFSRAYNNRGSMLSDLGRYDEALSDFNKAIELDPGSASAYDNRGNALARQGKPEQALLEYKRSLEIVPTRTITYNNRASAYFELKRFPEALADLESCRRLGGQPHPGLVQALAEATKEKR